MAPRGKIRLQLVSFLASGAEVKLSRRPRFAAVEYGFVVAVGAKWFMLQSSVDGGYFGGWIAYRISDVRRVKVDKSFGARFAATQQQWPPRAPVDDLNLDSTAGALSSLGAMAVLISIEKEHERRASWIGLFDEIIGKWVYLLEVKPSAKWHRRPLGYRLAAITRIAVGERYLTSLAEMAGPPPESSAVDE